MALFNIKEDEDYKIQGTSVAGITVSQGDKVVFLPASVIAKIKEKK